MRVQFSSNPFPARPCERVGVVVWELPSGRVRITHLRGDVFCTVLGQALGLLVPVGWALLLYTSGLSTPCSVGGLTP